MKRLWNLSLVNKVFLSYFAVALLLVIGFYFSSSSLIRRFYITTLSGRMEQEAHLLGRVLPFGLEGNELDALCRQLAGELGSRITVISGGWRSASSAGGALEQSMPWNTGDGNAAVTCAESGR